MAKSKLPKYVPFTDEDDMDEVISKVRSLGLNVYDLGSNSEDNVLRMRERCPAGMDPKVYRKLPQKYKLSCILSELLYSHWKMSKELQKNCIKTYYLSYEDGFDCMELIGILRGFGMHCYEVDEWCQIACRVQLSEEQLHSVKKDLEGD